MQRSKLYPHRTNIRIHGPKQADSVRGVYVDSLRWIFGVTVASKKRNGILRSPFMVGVAFGRVAIFRISL